MERIHTLGSSKNAPHRLRFLFTTLRMIPQCVIARGRPGDPVTQNPQATASPAPAFAGRQRTPMSDSIERNPLCGAKARPMPIC